MQPGVSLRFLVLLALAISTATISFAQDLGAPLSPVLVIDSDRVFRASLTGKKINEDLEVRLEALATENRIIEAELVAEELELTNRRKGMVPAEFRKLANAFDKKVQEIRFSQDAKQRELQQLRDDENQSFIGTITPILSAIGRERGALLILERRSVLLSADTIDITEEAIARINAASQADQNQNPELPGADPAQEQTEQPDNDDSPTENSGN